MKKRYLLLLASVLALSGCAKDSSAPPTQASDQSDPVTPDSKTVYICTSHTRTSGDSVTRTDYILDQEDRVIQVAVYTNDIETNRYDVECDEHGNYIRWISEDITSTYSYDEQGRPLGNSVYHGDTLISATEYTWEGANQTALINRNGPQEQRTAYFYNESGQKIRDEVYLDSVLVSYTHYTVGEDGRPVTQEVYQADGTLHSTVSYDYGGTGCTATTTLADGTLEGRTEYIYDDHGNLTSTTVYDSEGQLLSQTTDTWTPIQVPLDSLRASI